jgi:hypothetical protein
VAGVQQIEQHARASPKGVSFSDAVKLATHYFGEPRTGSGSHVAIFKMPWPGDPRINLQKGEGGKAKPYQVKQLISAIEKKKKEMDE